MKTIWTQNTELDHDSEELAAEEFEGALGRLFRISRIVTDL